MDNFKKRKKITPMKVIKIILGIILVFCLISYTVTAVFLGKNFPKSVRSEVTPYYTYEDIMENYPRTDVKFYSGKNLLKGYIYNEKSDKGIVVISHGIGGGGDSYIYEIMNFVDYGWQVLSFDNTGSFDSEGKSVVGLTQSVIDLDAAITFIEKDPELSKLPIMLYGHSWGGYAVTSLLGNGYSHKISASVSVAGYNKGMDMLFETAHSMMGSASYVIRPFILLNQWFIFGGKMNYTAVDGINATDTPVMLIHGENDDVIGYSTSSIISHRGEITNPNVEFVTCGESGRDGHNSLFLSERAAEYVKIVNEEFKNEYAMLGENPSEDDIISLKQELYCDLDKSIIGELDTELFNKINKFYENSKNN